jgi:hypothetical protein
VLVCPHCKKRMGRDHRCTKISRRHFFFGLLGGLVSIPIVAATTSQVTKVVARLDIGVTTRVITNGDLAFTWHALQSGEAGNSVWVTLDPPRKVSGKLERLVQEAVAAKAKHATMWVPKR